MAQAVVNFRIDADLKSEMEKLCKDLGLNLSSAFTIFARKMTRERRIPFDVSVDTPNEVTLAAMDAAERGEVQGPFNSVEEMMEALNA